jgi:AcrR family transcriptional regulator
VTEGRRPSGRPGRRSGDSRTSEAILDAARAQFAEHGYQGATIRGIAAGAGVDPALVHHFYGSKESLFAAAMKLPVVPSEVIATVLANGAGDAGVGERMVATALTLWESDGVKDTFLGLLRSAVTSEQAATMLREFVTDTILAAIVRAAGLDRLGNRAEAEYRATMVATQLVGIALTRLVLKLPAITAVSVSDLAATVGPTVERYLTGEIALPNQALVDRAERT